MFKSKPKTITAAALIKLANLARDEKRWADAAALYGEALRVDPTRADIHVQAGHMNKEAGAMTRAGEHYAAAAKMLPKDADLTAQLGHFYKVTARLPEATAAYRRALALRPGWAEVQAELDRIEEGGWIDPVVIRAQPVIALEEIGPEPRPDDLRLAPLYGRLAPELLPRDFHRLVQYTQEGIHLRHFGVGQSTFWGFRRVVRGVEAIRGICLSKARPTGIEVRVNGILLHRGPLVGPFELEYEPEKARIHKYVFNVWADFGAFVPGQYELELLVRVEGEGDRFLLDSFVIEPPLREEDHPDSDGILNLDPASGGTIEEQVAARPCVVHEAVRDDQIGEVRSILVARTDQLGDFVTSIPAVLRLRELFPQAKLVGLLSHANADLARSLGVFDDVFAINHRESWHERKRTLTLPEQEEIAAQLAPFAFDLAIDLAPARMGRPVLALAGARMTFGFHDHDWGRLSGTHDAAFSDPKNRREAAAHSKRMLGLVEQIGTMSRRTARIVRRDDLARERLAAYGIGADERFAALHTGARIVWSRWSHYLELAERLIADTDLKVALFTDDRALRDNLPPGLAGNPRLLLLDGQLPFDDFDALLSYCAVYVGNDSGPKHLAALRGVPVVSIHSARINWAEWGQEQTGVVVSRKVPCAGCILYHDADECGKDYACMKIGFDDVYAAVRRYV